MTRLIILGSRHYSPPRDVVPLIAELPDHATVIALGRSRVADAAQAAADSRGLDCQRLPLDSRREVLLREASAPGLTRTVVFAAREPGSREISQGTAGIIWLLNERGINHEVRLSPTPGRVGEAITTLLDRAETARGAGSITPWDTRRAQVLRNRVMQGGGPMHAVLDARDDYRRRLEDGWRALEALPDKGRDSDEETRWIDWLRCYQGICDALSEAATICGLDGNPYVLSVPDVTPGALSWAAA